MDAIHIKDAESLHKEGDMVDFKGGKAVIIMIVDDIVFVRDLNFKERTIIYLKGWFGIR